MYTCPICTISINNHVSINNKSFLETKTIFQLYVSIPSSAIQNIAKKLIKYTRTHRFIKNISPSISH